jgi:hypothetical protein
MAKTGFKSYFRTVIIVIVCAIGSLNFAWAQDCEAAFEVVPYSGPEPVEGGYTFINHSTGDYTNYTWDFGDGEFDSSHPDTVDHFYNEGGYKTAKLIIWGGDCFAVEEILFFVSLGGSPCDYTDCVLPGDANTNGLADYYDVLHIGMGYGHTGPVRPDASMEWVAQAAPDWSFITPDGVNGKHLDCNGDGVINEFDLQPVIVNNTPINNETAIYENDYPTLYLNFPTDTLYVWPDSTYNIQVTAELVFGSETVPVNQLSGIASRINMLSDLSPFVTEVNFDYDDNSFFGSGNAIMAAPALRHEEQVDLAVTHIDNSNASGFGKIGEVNFIIISDIVEGRSDGQVSFPASLHGIRATDANGVEKIISVLFNPASILFITAPTSGTTTPDLSERIFLYPNPVRDLLHFKLEGLVTDRVSIINTIGQEMTTLEMNAATAGSLDISMLGTGIYLLKIQTDQGSVIRLFQKQ